jgi:nucleotide-binding universal stress UspA family protein
MPLVGKILVPLSPSLSSIAALEYASSLADELGAGVDVLHVHEHAEFKVGSEVPLAPDAMREAEREMERAVQRAEARLRPRFHRSVVTGDPLVRILEVAAGGAFDLIVMGTHGRIGRLHAMLGSVTEGVVRSAPCPVLAVRVPEGDEQSFTERLRGGEPIADIVRARVGRGGE